MVVQTCLLYLATAIAKLHKQTQATKQHEGISRSHVQHGGDRRANWGLTVNNWKRWDKCRASLCAKVCADVSFLSASAHPCVSPATLLSQSPQIPVLPVSPCCLSSLFSLSYLHARSLSGWFSSACISRRCRTKWLWQHFQMLQLSQIYWVIKVMYYD